MKGGLGFWSLLALGVNGIVGVGIFFAPREVAALVPGSAGLWVFVLTALALSPVAVAYAMLGGRFGEDGGPYVWAREAFGPLFGFAVGWIAWVSALFSTAAVVAGLAEHTAPLAGIASPRLVAIGCVLVLAGVAASGLRPSAFAWNAITVLKLAPLIVIAAVFASSGPALPRSSSAPESVDLARAALIVVFALQGFEIVPVPAGHARGSLRNVSLATVLSLLFAAALYVVLHAACLAALPALATSSAPLAAAAGVLGGARFGELVAFGTSLSALGIAFGMFAMTPRYLAALGRADGFGPWVSREDARGVPQWALWATAIVVCGLVAAGDLTELFALSSVAVLTQYGVSVAALGMLAVKRRRGLGPEHLWPVPLALVAVVLLGHAARARELWVAFGVLALGLVLLGVRRMNRLQP